MAKKQVVGGVLFRKTVWRRHNISCEVCGAGLPIGKKVYNNGDKSVCGKCMGEYLKKKNQQLRETAFAFPVEETIYVGKKGHACSENCTYIPAIARFRYKKKEFELEIFRCSSCHKFIMSGEIFRKNDVRLIDYKLVRSSSGLPIGVKFSRDGDFLPYPPHKERIPIKSVVRWAATHPYQGGKVSPK